MIFRKLLLPVPGLFPPVLIDVDSASLHYQEMHVGGAVAQSFRTRHSSGTYKMRRGRTPVKDVPRARGAGEASRSKPMPI